MRVTFSPDVPIGTDAQAVEFVKANFDKDRLELEDASPFEIAIRHGEDCAATKGALACTCGQRSIRVSYTGKAKHGKPKPPAIG